MNSGEELVKAFRKVDPKLPIIVTAPPSRTPDDLQKSCPNASNYLTLPWVNIASIAGISGQLQLALLNGFDPSASNTFTVLTAASGLFGTFANVANGQRLATSDGLGSFLVNYGPGSIFNPNHIVLSAFQTAALPGDFNLDGKVDAADYVRWRKGLGTNYTPAHFNIWRAHFGQTAGSTSGVSANTTLPEPATFLLLTLGVAGWCLQRRRAA